MAPIPLTLYLPFPILKYIHTCINKYVFVIALVSAAVPITAEFFRARCVKYFVVYTKSVVVTHASAAPVWWSSADCCCCYLFCLNILFRLLLASFMPLPLPLSMPVAVAVAGAIAVPVHWWWQPFRLYACIRQKSNNKKYKKIEKKLRKKVSACTIPSKQYKITNTNMYMYICFMYICIYVICFMEYVKTKFVKYI